MTGLQRTVLLLVLVVGIPAAVAAGWYHYLPEYLVARAQHAAAAGDLEGSLAFLQQAIRQDPGRLDANLLRVQVLRRLHRPADAQANLLLAMKLGLPESVGRREFALAEAEKGFSPNAEANLERVLKENPDDAEVLLGLAEGYAQSERWASADRYYTRLLELQPERIDLLLRRGQVRLASVTMTKERLPGASDDFREVLRRSPDHYEARLGLAHCLVSDARMADAEQELLRCQELAPGRVEPLVGLAACAIENRAWDRAETLLQQALRLDAKSTYVLGMLGDLRLRQQQFERAAPYFQQVLDREPRNKAARLKLAQIYRFTGKTDRAKEQERIYNELTKAEQFWSSR
jgi:tetratricopeptide (TPR) repeat protein